MLILQNKESSQALLMEIGFRLKNQSDSAFRKNEIDDSLSLSSQISHNHNYNSFGEVNPQYHF